MNSRDKLAPPDWLAGSNMLERHAVGPLPRDVELFWAEAPARSPAWDDLLEDAPHARPVCGQLDCARIGEEGEAEFVDEGAQGVVPAQFINPLTPSSLVFDPQTGEFFDSEAMERTPAPDNEALLRGLVKSPTGVQQLRDPKLPLLPASLDFSKWLEPSFRDKVRMLARPQLIVRRDLFLWTRLPKAFPVFVRYPRFGTALVVRHAAYTGGGQRLYLYFAAIKLKPLGFVQGAPFYGGVWKVPADWCIRLPLAVMEFIPAEDLVTLVDDRAHRWTETFRDFSANPDWRYRMARRALELDFPGALTPVLTTQLLNGPPAHLQPGRGFENLQMPAEDGVAPVAAAREAAGASVAEADVEYFS